MSKDQDDPMEVDPDATHHIPKIVVSPALMNTIPRYGHQNLDEMTTQEEREHNRRKAEDNQIKNMDLKIAVAFEKANDLQKDRNREVMRINKRRDMYDENSKKKEEQLCAGESLRERRRMEAQEDDEWRKNRRNRGRNRQAPAGKRD